MKVKSNKTAKTFLVMGVAKRATYKKLCVKGGNEAGLDSGWPTCHTSKQAPPMLKAFSLSFFTFDEFFLILYISYNWVEGKMIGWL